jgi:hypothetical protein
MKITSIDTAERLIGRDPGAARDELHECVAALRPCLESLAQAFPGVIALGAILTGDAYGMLVLAPNAEANFYSPKGKTAVRELAQILACLPHPLRDSFEDEYAKAKARRARKDAREDARLSKAGPQS